MVALARSGGNKPLPAGFEPACETALPASAPHREFAEKTRALNGELEAFLKAQKDQEARPESEAGQAAPADARPEAPETDGQPGEKNTPQNP